MTGLGLSLTTADFKRVYEYPKAVLIGLVTQMILLPIICFFIVKALSLPSELAVGLMLLAAAPGGPSANLYSHIAKGDVALNVTLTALNSILSVISIAFIVNLSMKLLMLRLWQRCFALMALLILSRIANLVVTNCAFRFFQLLNQVMFGNYLSASITSSPR